MATLIDVGYQLLVLRWVYPMEALFVAFLLAFLPYLAVRGRGPIRASTHIRHTECS